MKVCCLVQGLCSGLEGCKITEVEVPSPNACCPTEASDSKPGTFSLDLSKPLCLCEGGRPSAALSWKQKEEDESVLWLYQSVGDLRRPDQRPRMCKTCVDAILCRVPRGGSTRSEGSALSTSRATQLASDGARLSPAVDADSVHRNPADVVVSWSQQIFPIHKHGIH